MEQQQQAQAQRSTPEKEQEAAAAAAVAAAIASGSLSAVAAAILSAMPLFGLAVLVRESPEKAAAVAAAASAISLSGPKSTAKGSRPEALFRAYYAMNAARRLSRAKDPEKALEREKLYFALHQKAQKLRMHSAKATESMVALHGPILSWHHGHPKEPRPNHLAADGHNFDTRRGVPQLTGALPGELPNCTCYWGPPIPGAPELR